jgi:hypothetical protein
VCKVRGITLNHKASQIVNFDTMKDLVFNGPSNSNVTVHTNKKTKRKRDKGACVSIITEPEDKIYRKSFSKRLRRDDNTSVPFACK